MPINLPIAEYQFTYQAIDKVSIPECSGTLWHSVLGKALHDSACIAADTKCENCMFLKQCDYGYLFRGIPPDDAEIMKRYRTVPVPHIIRMNSLNSYQVNPRDKFTITIALVGLANDKLAKLIQAMTKVGENGFRNDRKKARLIQIVQKIPYGYDKAILLQGKPLQLSTTLEYPIPTAPESIRINFITPFKPSGEAAESQEFLVDKFLMMIIRRISLLQYFYTAKKLDVDYSHLKQLTQSITVQQQAMYWRKHQQFSDCKNQHNQKFGWTGYVDLDLQNHKELWPYLFLGQWLNVGKNASMGFGQYQLID